MVTKVSPAFLNTPYLMPEAYGAVGDGTVDDSAAVAACLNAAKVNGTMVVASGQYRLDSLVTIPMAAGQVLKISGGAAFISNNATGGLDIGDNTTRQFYVQISDVDFRPNLLNSGYPFRIRRLAGGLETERSAVLENIFIGFRDDSETGKDFSNGWGISGTYHAMCRNVIVSSRSVGGTKWDHIVDASDSYKPVFAFCQCNVSAGPGAACAIKAGGTVEEGLIYNTSTFNGADEFLKYERTSREPEFQLIGGHQNHNGVGLRLNGVKFGFISHPLIYSTGVPGGTDAIDFLIEDADGLIIDKPQFREAGNNKRHFWLEPKTGKAGAVVNRIHIILSEASLFAQTPVAPIYLNGATNVVIEIPDDTDTADLSSYPNNLIEMGPSQDESEVTIITSTGRVLFGDAATSGPDLILRRISETPAVNDYLGEITFQGRNSAAEDIDYAKIRSRILDPTDGAEDGYVDHEVMIGGSLEIALRLGDPLANNQTGLQVIAREGGVDTLERVRTVDGTVNGQSGRFLFLTT